MPIRTSSISNRMSRLSTEEIKRRAEAGLIPSLERIINDPNTDHFTRIDAEAQLRIVRQNRGLDPDTGEQTEIARLNSLSKEELVKEWEADSKRKAAAELFTQQAQFATDWLNIEPRYKKTPKNAETMWKEIQRRGLVGTVSDLQTVFADLSAQGKMELNFTMQPRKVYTEAELRSMPLEQMKDAIDEMKRNGAF